MAFREALAAGVAAGVFLVGAGCGAEKDGDEDLAPPTTPPAVEQTLGACANTALVEVVDPENPVVANITPAGGAECLMVQGLDTGDVYNATSPTASVECYQEQPPALVAAVPGIPEPASIHFTPETNLDQFAQVQRC